MKKVISIIITCFILCMALPVSAEVGDEHFLLAPVETTSHEYIWSSGMRIDSEIIGYRNILEFDVTFPAIDRTCKLATYNTNMERTDNQAGHVSVFSVVDGKWSWKLENTAATIASNLDCGETYHIKVAVDLETKKQYCSVSKDGTVLGYIHGENLYTNVTGERINYSYRWFGHWTTANGAETGEWADEIIKPTNVKITRDASYSVDTPTITFEDGKVSASVMAYHNTLSSVDSPVLMLCLYDNSNMLLKVAAGQKTFLDKASSLPLAEELTAFISAELTPGMKVKAMVINKTDGRLLYGGVAEVVYTE